MACQIIPATPSDAPEIASIGGSTFENAFSYSMPAEDCKEYIRTTYSASAIQQQIDESEINKMFIAKIDNETLAFLHMKLGTTEPCIPADVTQCELYRLYVSTKAHGKGIGKRLMNFAIKWGTENITSRRQKGEKGLIWLGVWEENLGAQRLYKSFGFDKVGQHGFVMGATTQYDDILIKWV